jgi:hypothetical protein
VAVSAGSSSRSAGRTTANTVLVYEQPPLELVIDRCTYVLDEDGTDEHPGPIYVHVPDA